MHVIPTDLPGVLIIEPRVHGDARGFFLETFHAARYGDAGIPGPFVQDNHSRSAEGVLRGLHYQVTKPQGKLVRCVRGAVFDVAVDVRRGSPGFGRWVGTELTEEARRQLWIPPGFAHGFCVMVGPAEVEYKCTDYHAPNDESGIIWNDPVVGIAWPIADPTLSEKDRALPRLSTDRNDLPVYG
jgi:dTDP-4-dehydrorhamnose 3,5-epimerase